MKNTEGTAMTRKPTTERPPLRPNERGSAMALAILVILVLTIVGLAVAYFTQTEDRISGNARLVKAALYAADTGLRTGETIIGRGVSAGATIQNLISLYPGDSAITLPGGKSAVPLRVNMIGFMNVLVPSPTGSREVARYTLYVRNNDEDPGGPAANMDDLINLISVGQVVVPGSGGTADVVLTTKIIEEQLRLSATGNEFGAQKGANQGGTGAGTRG
jgi:hypothetical protein